MSAQEAVEAPRWTSTPGTDPHSVDDPFVLELEGGMSAADIESLKGRGHDVVGPSGQSVRRLGEADRRRSGDWCPDGRL